MEKSNGFSATLIPLIAAAGLLSGTLLRPNAVPDRSQQEKRAERPHAEASPEIPGRSGLADVQPVLDLLGESLGVSLEPNAALRAAQALRLDAERDGRVSSQQVIAALQALQNKSSGSSTVNLSDDNPAAIVDSYLRSDIDAGSRLHKLRSQVVDRIFDELAAEESMRRLMSGLHASNVHWNVKFLIATVPDYVDSNSGWVADETIGAIQSAMSNAGFVLDRFRLIDWSRAEDDRSDKFVNSKLHERQPGALIFRKVPGDDSRAINLEVVLLVLETPTTGVHRTALRSAIRFIHRWQTSSGVGAGSSIGLIAPVFSGSVPSLALELNDLQDLSSRISVVTGSAMADVNQPIMERFAPHVAYRAAAPRTSDVTRALANALERMNSRWQNGNGVALLIEANTSFGNDAMG